MKTRRQCFFKYMLYTLLMKRHKSFVYNQKLQMFDNNTIMVPDSCVKNIILSVIGKNNEIIISDNVKGLIDIYVFGDNNKIIIEDGVKISQKLSISIGQNHKNFGSVQGCKVSIGENTTFESTQIVLKNSGAKVSIGKDCMFAFNITLYNTDSHPVFDLNTKQIVNSVKDMNIGNHVWIGANTTILKNTSVADDCIVGWGSVVSGKHAEPHCALAGNPARQIKRGITWDPNGAKFGYIENN